MHCLRYVIAVAACVGCAAEEVRTKPEAPDMSALVNGYASPSRNFDEATAIELQSLVESKVAKLFDLDALQAALDDALSALAAEDMPAPFAPPRHSLDLEGEGFARITRICRGHGTPAPPVSKEANGFLDLTVGYSQEGLDSVVFGKATACREEASGARLDVAGAVNLYVGENLKVDQVTKSPIIFQLADFAFDVDGARIVDGGFDFQICRGTESGCVAGNFEILIGLQSNTTIVFFVDLAARTGGFRAANGIWRCDFSAGQCNDGAGNTVNVPGYQL